MVTATKRTALTEEEIYGYNPEQDFSRREMSNAEIPVKNYGYVPETRYTAREVRNPNAERAARLLFDRGDIDLEDKAPIGSQGAVSTPSDRYFSPFIKEESGANQRMSRPADGNTVYVPPYEAKSAKNEFKYFSGEAIAEPAVKKRKETALKPTTETLQYRERKTENEKKALVSNKHKILIAAYAAVVIFLIAMIITSGVTAGKLRQEVNVLNNNVTLSQSINENLKEQLILINNDSVLKDKAEEIGMVPGEGSAYEEITLIPLVSPVEYNVKTNWFDRLCDWLSGIFGG